MPLSHLPVVDYLRFPYYHEERYNNSSGKRVESLHYLSSFTGFFDSVKRLFLYGKFTFLDREINRQSDHRISRPLRAQKFDIVSNR